MAKKLSELKSRDQIVVKLHAIQGTKDSEAVTIKPEQEIVMTKSAYESIERNTNNYSPALNRKVTPLGIPKFKKIESDAGGKVDVLDGFEAFAQEEEVVSAA
ncbi:hypothetical protein [Spirosoma oryzicola]|uniref:hypothetical protein n=1 Tax=Spirosoma oryzicola TaxID=2898794 RepID=UPI001E347EF5|nr:hypothetical protein [Spirosoma oryzicola]UHG93280.1 hypothetical protein LQ777_10345 [Spirosoma oryzicola]